MQRRSFLGGLIATASGLLIPYEPERVYSFATPRPRVARVAFVDAHGRALAELEQEGECFYGDADTTGIASHARLYDGAGRLLGTREVGVSGAPILLNTTSIVTGARVAMSGLSFTPLLA